MDNPRNTNRDCVPICLHDIGIIPVVKLDDASQAVNLADALIKGGIPVAEVTFRTSAAEQSIKMIHVRQQSENPGSSENQRFLRFPQCEAFCPSTMAIPADAPMRFAPASIMAFASSYV